MSTLSPADIQALVTKAFVLEALTDKPGCTTRFVDLPGKPLQDFVIAGINSSDAFRSFADARQAGRDRSLFSYNLQALQAANRHKSAKFINFGLLEIMFPVVAARLDGAAPETAVDAVIALVKRSGTDDVAHLLATRRLAWSTSGTHYKTGFPYEAYTGLGSVWDFYMAIHGDHPPESSNYQWTEEFRQGLPILRSFFDAYMDAGEMLLTTGAVFAAQRKAYPHVKVGILADMCAAAMFLWFSYADDDTTTAAGSRPD